METMALLARTAPPLAGTGRRPSAAVRPSAFLSFAAASTATRGREVEQSYIMVKPDGVQRGLVGEIISRFEKKGFLLKGLKLFQCSKDLAQEHYKDLKDKPFFPTLINYITSGPVVCMNICFRNVVHGSDSPDNGKREIALWFKEGELCQWESVQTPWLVE
ncbi:Nucleoside diphosphate kinase 2, chloroplastic [Dichanthelium oligosanthes]|uniref:Nucleoside diphosphate kinase n=1 Tax=Dichanthelium oligosanthes TaxID=888268 RepID=A0A1E5WBZ3_9POAL|nr:Nucleoside diphosphate kinase 2, chloroplastic [Dichanthelium oligosanthes]